MDAYRRALSAYLEPEDRNQEAFAAEIGKTQPAVNRYVKGRRFPDADTARKIDTVTAGAVPFQLWQRVQMDRLGMERAA